MKIIIQNGVSRALITAILLTSALAVSAQSLDPITDDTFTCLNDMTRVNHFFVDNLLGDVEATVAVANSETGGVYPVGSVVQLVPGEAMIKREEGFNETTRDWEFFELDVSSDGTSIRKRGFTEVVNRFGGNCFDCHVKAEPQWDLICDNFHGCDPIPLTRSLVSTIQKTDPRCEPSTLDEEDMANMKILKAMRQGAAGQ